MALIEMADGIFDEESGEIHEWPDDMGHMAFIAYKFMESRRNSSTYEGERKKWQKLLIKKMGDDESFELGNNTLRVQRQQQRRFQPEFFRKNLVGQELTHEDYQELLAAASSFDRELVATLPIPLKRLVEEAYSTGAKEPFIEVA